jgi:hypothetical protein
LIRSRPYAVIRASSPRACDRSRNDPATIARVQDERAVTRYLETLRARARV